MEFDIKKINDINQLLKKIFNSYIISSIGYIYPYYNEPFHINYGYHFGKIVNEDYININYNVDHYDNYLINSNAFFQFLKECKKKDLQSEYKSNKITLNNKSIDVDLDILFALEDDKLYINKIEGIQSSLSDISISEIINFSYKKINIDIINDLLNNKKIILDRKNKEVVITKELFPGLKHNFDISYHIVNSDIYSNIVFFKITRGIEKIVKKEKTSIPILDTYHIYRYLK